MCELHTFLLGRKVMNRTFLEEAINEKLEQNKHSLVPVSDQLDVAEHISVVSYQQQQEEDSR